MLTICTIIMVGAVIVYCSLCSRECDHCYKRKQNDLYCARAGLAIVAIGCVLACWQFATFCV